MKPGSGHMEYLHFLLPRKGRRQAAVQCEMSYILPLWLQSPEYVCKRNPPLHHLHNGWRIPFHRFRCPPPDCSCHPPGGHPSAPTWSSHQLLPHRARKGRYLREAFCTHPPDNRYLPGRKAHMAFPEILFLYCNCYHESNLPDLQPFSFCHFQTAYCNTGAKQTRSENLHL